MDVIVFGIGKYYKIKKDAILSRHNIIGYLDNSIKPGEKMYVDQKIVLNPQQLSNFPANVPILLMSAKFMEMYVQMRQYNVSKERILFGTDFMPPYDPFEEMLIGENGRIIIREGDLVLQVSEEEYVCNTQKDFENVVRTLYGKHKPEIEIISNLPLNPVSRRYGREHGTPIDRFYIERFLDEHREYICGDVAEFADDTYTKRYGTGINNNYILHVNGWGKNSITANLVTGEGIIDEMLDCLICTQTIQFIYEIKRAICNILRLLKPGGCALITAHGIAQISLYDYRNWGEYWRFTEQTFIRIAEEQKIKECEIHSHGNVKIATALLYGLSVEDLDIETFEYDDEQYPVVITMKLVK